jgi:hypothetical protein
MIPNRFVDHGPREFHAIDASLWFVIAAGEFLRAAPLHEYTPREPEVLRHAMQAIVQSYRDGTRFNIGMDREDCLIRGGQAGYALTWMDARIGTWCMTPRVGKPVEIQSLWISALEHVCSFDPSWTEIQTRAKASVQARYYNIVASSLFDVVDLNMQPGLDDAAIRPNQLYAIGGLGPSLLNPTQTGVALETVERELFTPMGMRSLAPRDSQYCPRYLGNVEARDVAYHQGTVWPYLMGPFIEAWVRHRGSTIIAKQQARTRFFEPFLAAARTPGQGGVGLGHIAEIADGQAPHIGRGCPFQAWSVAEALRLDLDVLRP